MSHGFPGGTGAALQKVISARLAPLCRACGRRHNYVGCIAGALSFAEYRAGLEAAGFTDIQITAMHRVADGMHSAIVRAGKPATATGTDTTATSSTDASCCGVTDCCTPAEQATDPSSTVGAAKGAAGCACQS